MHLQKVHIHCFRGLVPRRNKSWQLDFLRFETYLPSHAHPCCLGPTRSVCGVDSGVNRLFPHAPYNTRFWPWTVIHRPAGVVFVFYKITQ